MEKKGQLVFTVKAISVATFFGGPIAAGMMIAKNYFSFERKNAARKSIVIGAIVHLFIFAAIAFIPGQSFPKYYYAVLPVIFAALFAGIGNSKQGKQLDQILKEKGRIASVPAIAVYVLTGLLANGLFIVWIVFSAPADGFEKKIQVKDKVLMYYNEKMDKANSQEIADAIKESRFLEGSKGADLFLGPGDKNYKLMFVLANENLLKDTGFLKSFHDFEDFMNQKLTLDKDVSVCFTSKDMTTEYDLPAFHDQKSLKKKEMGDLQVFFINQNINVYHNKIMDRAYLQKLQESILSLPGYFPPDEGIDMVFLDNGPDFSLKFFVLKEYWDESDITGVLKSTVEFISDKGMGKPIRLFMVDNRDYSEIEL